MIHFQKPDRITDPLYVVTTVFNPIRFQTRWKLYQEFETYILATGQNVKLYTVEVAFGDRQFTVTDPNNTQHLQLRTRSELWLKENSLNLLINRLPSDWKYVAWIDADVSFARRDWDIETVQQLQHYDVVQMFSEAFDLGPTHETIKKFRSYLWCYVQGIPFKWGTGDTSGGTNINQSGHTLWHPGYAWAARRDALGRIGGLIDWTILGGGDLFMANALTGQERLLPESLGSVGLRWLKHWTDRAQSQIRGNVGHVDGALFHYWHGPKVNRRYRDRGQIMIDTGFDPETDIHRDAQGLWQLSGNKPKLRDGIREYFRQRNEDSISLTS